MRGIAATLPRRFLDQPFQLDPVTDLGPSLSKKQGETSSFVTFRHFCSFLSFLEEPGQTPD